MTIEIIKSLLIVALWAVPLVTALVQVLKKFIKDTRFLPVISIALGVVVSLFIVELSLAGAIVGILIGLGSCGLYDFGSKTIAGK